MTGTALLPRLLDRDVMPLSELLALWLDGQVYRLGDVFALPDLPETAELRAAAFAATSRTDTPRLPSSAILSLFLVGVLWVGEGVRGGGAGAGEQQQQQR